MPNENNNGRKWPDRSILVAILAAIVGDGYLSWSGDDRLAEALERGIRTEQQIIGHLFGHPDAGLTLRMNAMQGDHDELEHRVRIMEIRLGVYDAAE